MRVQMNFSYIFYTNQFGNPTFLSANTSYPAFLPQPDDDVLARLPGNDSTIVTLAAAPAVIVTDPSEPAPTNGVVFAASSGSDYPIAEYSVALGNPTPSGLPAQQVFSTGSSMAFVNHGGITYFLTPALAPSSSIQFYYTDWSDPGTASDWHIGAQAAVGIPAGRHFCADGALFAFQAADGSLHSAAIQFDDDSAKTTLGPVTPVDLQAATMLNGTHLACRWMSATDMAIYLQEFDNALSYMQVDH
jgi:hypothetical protein